MIKRSTLQLQALEERDAAVDAAHAARADADRSAVQQRREQRQAAHQVSPAHVRAASCSRYHGVQVRVTQSRFSRAPVAWCYCRRLVRRQISSRRKRRSGAGAAAASSFLRSWRARLAGGAPPAVSVGRTGESDWLPSLCRVCIVGGHCMYRSHMLNGGNHANARGQSAMRQDLVNKGLVANRRCDAHLFDAHQE